MKTILLIPTALLLIGAAIAAAPSAHADPQQDYLDMLRSTYGFNVTDSNRHTLLAAGNAICGDLRAGTSPETEIRAIFRSVPNATEKQAGNLVSAAQFKLCPDTIGDDR